MKSDSVAFVEELVRRCCGIACVLQEHLADYDEILPHVFMADLGRAILSGTNERQCIVGVLENGIQNQSDEVKNLIAASFVFFFESDSELERALSGLEANALRTEWQRQRNA